MLTLIRCPFQARVTAVAREDPAHSAKSAGGKLELNTHTPLIPRKSYSGLNMMSRHSEGTCQGNELTLHSGNTRSQSSQLAGPLWTEPGLKNGTGLHELISTIKEKEKSAGGK